jgi:hypothetical protein
MKVLALSAAAILLLGACSGSDEEAASGEGDSTEIRTSPLAELLGHDLGRPGDPVAVEQQQLEEEQQRQELIAACMEEKGFEYIPIDAGTLVGLSAVSGPGWGTKAWAETWGFGVTTRWFPQSMLDGDLIGYDDPRIDDGDRPEDPNAAIVGALDPEQQDAYYAARYGDYSGVIDDGSGEGLGGTGGGGSGGGSGDLGGDDGSGEVGGDDLIGSFDGSEYEPLGCEGEAYTEVASYDAASSFQAQFESELEAMYTQIDRDPRMVEARQQVADCVAGEGLEHVTAEDYRVGLEPTFTALQQELYPTQDLTSGEMDQMTREEIDAAFAQTGSLSPESQAQLADLQAQEIELAVTAYECGEGSTDYQATISEVRVEYEQAFLDEHAEAVAEYRN